MFWLRFFGSRTRDNNANSALAFSTARNAQSTKLRPFDGCFIEYEEHSDSTEEEEVIKSRGGRRSAIDLSNTSYSLDIGQAAYRLSFDVFANPSYQLTSLLKGFTDFTTLHRGSHARILKAEKKFTDEFVVFKLYEKSHMSPSQIDNISKELEILRKGVEYGTVKLLDVFEDDRLLLLNLEECSNGTLMACMDDHDGYLSEELCIKYIVSPLLKTLAKLHEAGVIHRDIKPEHILFDEHYQPRLCDFHAAGIVGRDAFNDREGTLSYMAPEIVTKPTPEGIFHVVLSHGVDETDLPSYNEKVDIWSLGVVIVEALTGMMPFMSDTAEGMQAVHASHFSGENYSVALHQLEKSSRISEEGLDFISKVICEDPNDRPDAATLLTHPWLDVVF